MMVALLGFFSCSAHAGLSCEVANVNKTISAGTIPVPVGAAVGQTVATLAPDGFQFPCWLPAGQASTLWADLSVPVAPASGFSDVYPTGVPGLGVRYSFNSAYCGARNVVLANGGMTLTCSFTGPIDAYSPDLTVTASFVVTGQIAAGAATLTSAPRVNINYRHSDSGGSWAKSPLYTGSANGVLTQATCSVNQTSVSVIMPTADTRAFSSGLGAVAAPQPFTLSLTCQTGAKVLITLTDAVNPANRGTSLQLTADSSAAGIGIQILNTAGSPVVFGADSATPGNANQWPIGDSPNGMLQIPLTARYVRTGAVTAGTVKGLATFTMSYQ
ncbi:fimbrial protein [Caballeronia hypogeia]|uniref:fimbrial protein n=1 Tax=Caballeronia hypogeia TaxID=1777140 RepID=UPI001E3975C7|nr:fimbrial protein [Caballeronia hypogeia]